MRTVNFGCGPVVPPDAPPKDDGYDPSPEVGSVLVYDCEIKQAIERDDKPREPDIAYCRGWRDFENMGISLITAYDYATSRYRIFMEDNFQEFQQLVNRSAFVVGFNNVAFDDQLCDANGISVPPAKSVDLLRSVWESAGLPGRFAGTKSHGYGLDALYKANIPGGRAKTGHGADAPILYQRREYGKLIDYGLNDTQMTTEVLMLALGQGWLTNPKDPGGPKLPVRDFLPQDMVQLMPWHESILPGAADLP